MEFITGFINVKSLMQNLYELPIVYDKYSHKICPNPLRKQCPTKMYNWFLMGVEAHFLFLFCFTRLVWLLSQFRHDLWSNLDAFEEVAVYTIYLVFTTIGMLTVWTVEVYISEACWVTTQTMNQLQPIKKLAICAVCIVLNTATIPSGEAKKFKNYWRRRKLNVMERKELESCWEIALSIGQFGKLVRTTPCDIFMVILNYSATIILALKN
ncbi:unnamed protein product [Orchesella dallaii]|uniref:Uncharacterized protein n=1 Tax=Orchesella dallaii TaxID=48710 RepID=A0ABP1RJ72_9HEXA